MLSQRFSSMSACQTVWWPHSGAVTDSPGGRAGPCPAWRTSAPRCTAPASSASWWPGQCRTQQTLDTRHTCTDARQLCRTRWLEDTCGNIDDEINYYDYVYQITCQFSLYSFPRLNDTLSLFSDIFVSTLGICLRSKGTKYLVGESKSISCSCSVSSERIVKLTEIQNNISWNSLSYKNMLVALSKLQPMRQDMHVPDKKIIFHFIYGSIFLSSCLWFGLFMIQMWK